MIARNDYTDKKEIAKLDAINNERLENTKKRVAHAISFIKPWIWRTFDNDEDKQKMLNEISHAVNLLEVGNQEMKWHCEWYDYNQEVCSLIDDACSDLGMTLANIINDEEDDIEMLTCDLKDGLVKLSKALATLIRWNDETQDVSEV